MLIWQRRQVHLSFCKRCIVRIDGLAQLETLIRPQLQGELIELHQICIPGPMITKINRADSNLLQD